MIDLLPCPFCGGEAKREDIEAREGVENAGASYIACDRCWASTALHFDRKENLDDSWNRRKWHLSEEQQFSDAFFRALPEPRLETRVFGKGDHPWEFWSREDIEQAIADILNPRRCDG